MSIKTFLIEEHHEAFFVWQYAIQKGLLSKKGNLLYHVDEHSDLSTPRFNTSIHDLNNNLQALKKFTYQELGIANFIMPAIYLGVFNKVVWFKQNHRSLSKNAFNMFIKSYGDDGMRLISGKTTDNILSSQEKKVLFVYEKKILSEMIFDKNIVLDIDLDYFSCSGDPNLLNEIHIEITHEEYISFQSDPYHRINFTGIGRIEAIQENGKYYYLINYYKNVYPNNLRVEADEIIKRIDLFGEQLKSKEIVPKIIDICRSRKSGYTPKDQWEFIEYKLLEKLRNLYDIELIYLPEIV